jgi:hypothetical protein
MYDCCIELSGTSDTWQLMHQQHYKHYSNTAEQ